MVLVIKKMALFVVIIQLTGCLPSEQKTKSIKRRDFEMKYEVKSGEDYCKRVRFTYNSTYASDYLGVCNFYFKDSFIFETKDRICSIENFKHQKIKLSMKRDQISSNPVNLYLRGLAIDTIFYTYELKKTIILVKFVNNYICRGVSFYAFIDEDLNVLGCFWGVSVIVSSHKQYEVLSYYGQLIYRDFHRKCVLNGLLL